MPRSVRPSGGTSEEALELHSRALSLDDESGSAWYGCGVALFRLGRVDEAIEAFERCVAVSPDDVAAWEDLGTCFARKHSIKRAIAAWKKVMELDPQADIVRHLQVSLTASSSDRGEWYGMLGNVQLAKRNYSKAATFFDQALAVDPKRSAVWNDRGLCADVLENPIKAIEYFDRALALEPTNAYAWYTKVCRCKGRSGLLLRWIVSSTW